MAIDWKVVAHKMRHELKEERAAKQCCAQRVQRLAGKQRQMRHIYDSIRMEADEIALQARWQEECGGDKCAAHAFLVVGNRARNIQTQVATALDGTEPGR